VVAIGAGDLLSTPIGYATPEQIDAANQLANILQKTAYNSGRIQKPIQGVSNMVNAAISGWERGTAAKEAQQGRDAAAQQIAALRNQLAQQQGQVPQPAAGTAPVASAPAASAPAAPAASAPAAPAANAGWNPAWGSPSPPPTTGAVSQPWTPQQQSMLDPTTQMALMPAPAPQSPVQSTPTGILAGSPNPTNPFWLA
jgi:hypothetical protein